MLTKKEENQQWKELYEYVQKEILGYTDMKLPRNLVLRLRGLREGKFMANKKCKPLGDYEYRTILLTFKMYKYEIVTAIGNQDKFKDENHKVNYLMAIVESKINDIQIKLNKTKKTEEKAEILDIENNTNKVTYKSKTKKVTNSRLKDLM